MPVEAKFYVQNVERFEGSTASRVTLGAVCRGIENREWASATPGGSIQMTIRNDAAVDQFEAGKEYLVTFTKVSAPARGDGHRVQPVRANGSLLCGTCGTYARLQDGVAANLYPEQHPDEDYTWEGHEEFYGAPQE